MGIKDLLGEYAGSQQVTALAHILEDKSAETVFLQGLMASAAPVMFAAAGMKSPRTILFILQDADEAAYFYNDIEQTCSSLQFGQNFGSENLVCRVFLSVFHLSAV